MKIGMNVKKLLKKAMEEMYTTIGSMLEFMSNDIDDNTNNIASLESRVNELENISGGSSDWIEITEPYAVECELNQAFKEIMIVVCCTDGNFCVNLPYTSDIFYNSGTEYIIVGNPTENNYGVKLKHTTVNNKQYIGVEYCFTGGSYESYELSVYIKPESPILQ